MRDADAGTSRSSRVLGALLLLVAGGALMWPASAIADCVPPTLSLEKPTDSPVPPLRTTVVQAGSKVTVYGEWFHSGCNDTGGGPCSGERERPIRDIELVLTQDGKSWTFGRHNAKGKYFAVHWDVDLPAEVRPGRAVLTAQAKEMSAELDIEVR